MSSRRAPFPIQKSTGKRSYVKVNSKKYVVEVMLNLLPQHYYNYYYYYYYWVSLLNHSGTIKGKRLILGPF